MKRPRFRNNRPRPRRRQLGHEQALSGAQLQERIALMESMIADDTAAHMQWLHVMGIGLFVCVEVTFVTSSYTISGAFDLARTPDRLLLATLYGVQLALFLRGVWVAKSLYSRVRSGQPLSDYAYEIRWRAIRFVAVECALALALIKIVQQRGWLYDGTHWVEVQLRAYLSANWSRLLSTLLTALFSGIVGNAGYDLLKRMLPFRKTKRHFTTHPTE
jgi:hypothetical protein